MNHAAKESFLTCFQLVAEYMSTERKIVLYIYIMVYIYNYSFHDSERSSDIVRP